MLNHLEHSGFTAIIPSKEMMVPMGLWSSETIQVISDVSEPISEFLDLIDPSMNVSLNVCYSGTVHNGFINFF